MGEKEYLGDGVYGDIEHGQIVITTSDGIAETNRIYLEPEVYAALVRYVERRRAVPVTYSVEASGVELAKSMGDAGATVVTHVPGTMLPLVQGEESSK